MHLVLAEDPVADKEAVVIIIILVLVLVVLFLVLLLVGKGFTYIICQSLLTMIQCFFGLMETKTQ